MADQILRLIITGNTSQATREMKKLQRDLQSVSQSVTNTGKAMTMGLTLPIVAAGGAMTKMAMDAFESENLFGVSMGRMADSAREWSEQLSESLGLNSYEVRRMVGTFNVMLGSLGQSEDAAYGMAKGLTELAYDMASFYDLTTEDAFEKLQAGITGEVEPLKRLGIVVNETMVKQYALREGIIKTGDTLTESQKIQARYGLILEQTTKAQGDWKRSLENGSPAVKLKALQAGATELGIAFGQLLIPSLVDVIDNINGLVKWFASMDEGQKKAIVNVALFAAAMGPVVFVIGKAVAFIAAMHKAYMVLIPVVRITTALKAGEITLTEALALATGKATVAEGLYTAAKIAGNVAAVAAAAGVGYLIGQLINQIPAVKEAQEALGSYIADLKSVGQYQDEANKKWGASAETQAMVAKMYDASTGELTEYGRALQEKNAQQAAAKTAEENATKSAYDLRVETDALKDATAGYTDELIYQNNYLTIEDTAERNALEAKIAKKRAQQELNDAIKKYGKNSTEAKLARIKLTEAENKAKDTRKVANDQAKAAKDLASAWRDAAGNLGKYIAKFGKLTPKEKKSLISAALHDPGYAIGGIATGPTSGYAALLHGTEAILPLNNPRRYLEVLKQANERMGFGSAPAAVAAAPSYVINVNADSMSDRRAIAAAVDDVMSSYARNGRSLRAGGAFA